MKRILVTAGGTAIAWHIANIAEQYFSNGEIELFICDTNKPKLVPASTKAKKTFMVPPSSTPEYSEILGRIVHDNNIDHIIPLLPQESFLFASDSEFVKKHKVTSSAPATNTSLLLTDKSNLYKTLTDLSIPTPRLLSIDKIDKQAMYIIKPKLGFGSVGIRTVSGSYIADNSDEFQSDDIVIQEYCHNDDYDEATVEIYNGSEGLSIFARRRIATKAGVCVKMEPINEKIFYPYISDLVKNIECPKAFNVQFLLDNGQWKLFDCNLRLGAGTALSTSIGFQLTRSLLAEIVGAKVDKAWFDYDKSVKTVLRVYQEIVIK